MTLLIDSSRHLKCLEYFSLTKFFFLQLYHSPLININSNCLEMTDIVLEFLFCVIHVLISAYVLD